MTAKLQADISVPVDSTRRQMVGSVRTSHPVYVNLLPPCNDACPAGEDIQGWLDHAQAGRFQNAWEVLIRDNPFPAIHGRVCYHPCEASCNRKHLDSTVSIHAVERFLGDQAVANNWPMPIEAPPSGKRALVVGAGPSGLSAAYHLARLGHQVEIHESGPVAGGMLHFGIPAYRLPRDVVEKEAARLTTLGVRFVFNHKIEDVLAEQQDGRFDAVYIAVGAQVSSHVEIPARDSAKVLEAVSLLRHVAGGERPRLGRRVVIYGGGNTAMDAARTARRLGAVDALIIYRRDRAHMPAHPTEADEAIAEGVKIKWLSGIKEISGSGITVERMQLDADGRPQPTGELETLAADTLVLALGQTTDTAFLRKIPGIALQSDGTIIVGPDLQTSHTGIFAGGDVTPTHRTVTNATGQGKRAARHIDAWLRGTTLPTVPRHRIIPFEGLHLPMYSDTLAMHQAELAPAQRDDFAEVVAGLDAAQTRYESKRCLSCGNCYECDNCYAACPEDAIVKLGPGRGYAINMQTCTGCAVCFDRCPCHAIDMVAETSAAAEGT
jgi:NADPH-dependent glutamate synthase beta subunit-like oxidoreductase